MSKARCVLPLSSLLLTFAFVFFSLWAILIFRAEEGLLFFRLFGSLSLSPMSNGHWTIYSSVLLAFIGKSQWTCRLRADGVHQSRLYNGECLVIIL